MSAKFMGNPSICGEISRRDGVSRRNVVDAHRAQVRELAEGGASPALISKFLWLHKKLKISRQGVAAAIKRWRQA